MFIVQAINLIFNQYTNWLQTKQNYRIIRANGIICLAKKIFNSEGFLFVTDNNHLSHLNFCEDGSRKSGSQRSEVGSQKSEVRKSEVRSWKTEDGRP